MIIDVDMGNSRIKWCSSASPELMHAHETDSEAQNCWRALEGVVRVRVAAVVDPERVEQMLVWCRRYLQVEAEIATVKGGGASGIQLAYAKEAVLGVDRWLAMHAARHRFEGQDIIIASGGTALTIDYLNASGRHLGGYIIPGWRAAVNALLEGTKRIKSAPPQLKKNWRPGDSTLSCVEGGLALMYRGVLCSAVQIELPDFHAAKMIITGGDGELLKSFGESEIACVYDPMLVLRGLPIVLP